MSEDFPTFVEVASSTIRERAERTGEPVDYLLNYLENRYERGE